MTLLMRAKKDRQADSGPVPWNEIGANETYIYTAAMFDILSVKSELSTILL